ncbi:MAG: cytochrome c [Elusimicrobia bacterium]|nr:cytochrome c [Elusimicrobiota bacterium]
MNKRYLVYFALAVVAVTSPAWSAEDPIQALYNQKCASCHGKDGKGTASMAKMFKVDIALLDLTDKATLDKKDDVLDGITAKGVAKMPGYETKLKPEQIKALTAYFRSLAKPKR